MDLLPFLREASEYSSAITVALWVLVSLQLKLQTQKYEIQRKVREDGFEKRIDGKLAALSERLTRFEDKITDMDRSLLREVNAIAQRVSQIEGRISRLRFLNGSNDKP